MIDDIITVYVVEDHELVLRGLQGLIETSENIKIIGQASSIRQALEAIPNLKPDVLLLDLRLPDGLGTEVVRGLAHMEEVPKSLILTSYVEDSLVLEAMSANVNGYILKDVIGEELVESIVKVFQGQAVYSVGVSDVMASIVRGESNPDNHRGRIEALTAQEFRVLEEVSKGKSNKEVADSLSLSEKTVKNYISNILSKLGYSSRTEAAVNFVKNFS